VCENALSEAHSGGEEECFKLMEVIWFKSLLCFPQGEGESNKTVARKKSKMMQGTVCGNALYISM